jgi:CDP-glycerol glycerophosphotransferase (TagB/SpsB family)
VVVEQMRQVIKKVYMLIVGILNIIFAKNKIKKNNIVIMMTFSEDVMPIIKALVNKNYNITVIAKPELSTTVKTFKQVQFIPAGNKQIFKHMRALSSAKVIVIDTYYLMLGGYKKKRQQTIIQTWHAAGALKNFGLTDHQVDLSNATQVEQYRRVYQATDYYLVGGEPMAQCFKESFEARDDQILPTGLPRLSAYNDMDIRRQQQQLKTEHHIEGKVAVYLPTYREKQKANRHINKQKFEQQLDAYTLLNKLHPAVASNSQTTLDIQSLMIMADIIITDYSSLAIEASLLNKPAIFYVYDEDDYDKDRGLNRFYKDIPNTYKAYTEDELIELIQNGDTQFQPLFKEWHKFNSQQSTEDVIHFIEEETNK